MAPGLRPRGPKPGAPVDGKPTRGRNPASSRSNNQQRTAPEKTKHEEHTLVFQGKIWEEPGTGDIDMNYLLKHLRLKQEEVDKSFHLEDPKARHTAHWNRTTATVNYEQFLYYQNITHRHARLLLLKAQRAELESRWKKRDKTQGLWKYGGLWDYTGLTEDPYLVQLLDYYDEIGVGAYRDRIQRSETSGIHPDDLHLWTPPPRRHFVGLSNPPRGPEMPSFTEFQLDLDEEAIEAKRAEVEGQTLTPAREGMHLEYNTHSERRLNELPFDDWRPMTSNVRGADPQQFKDSFQNIRTETGLFIAAKESSYDWLTSYDCLGKLVNNRRTIPIEKPEADKASKETSSQQTKQGTQKPPNREGTTRSTRGTPAASSSKPSEDYDYDYPDNEFTRPPSGEKLRTTERTSHISEATTGRREWHVARKVLDHSPPTSPPIAPRPYTTDIETIPDGIPSEHLEPPQYLRCIHKKTCRAGWVHPPSECWEAEVEDFGDLKAPRHPASVNILNIPETSRETYRSRLEDHYGRMQSTEDQSWPTLGIRVPYSPITLYDDPDVQRDFTSRTSSDNYHRSDAICGVNTMTMPILTTFINEPERTSGPTAPLPDPQQFPPTRLGKAPVQLDPRATGSGEESSDDPDDLPSPGAEESLNDLFRQTYLGGIQAQQGQQQQQPPPPPE